MRLRTLAAGLLAWAATAMHASADIRLPSVIGSNMVVQRDRLVPIWGWDDPGTTVTVTLGGQSKQATAGDDGKWMVRLDAMPAGGPHEITIAGKNTVKLDNVLVGEVWVCSGQSNMEWSVRASNNPEEEIKNANYPKIRIYNVVKAVADTPQSDCKATPWSEVSPQTIANFSAVGYFFGRHLHTELEGVPIGLIGSNWGGTASEPWAALPALQAKPSLKPLLDRWDAAVAKDPEKAGKSNQRPANLYNAMIHPLVPFAIRGAIWYQGESNVGRAYQYRTVFPTMIESWRDAWGQGQFPFLFVQLAPFRYGNSDPAMCAELWEAQLMTLKTLPNTGMAVTTDISDIKDIHPRNKQDVGKRLALWAMATTYGQRRTAYSGPIYSHYTINGDRLVLHFNFARGLATRDGNAPSDFTLAGPDKKFHPAQATIEGNTIVLRSDAVPNPVAARFAWFDTAEPNLVNQSGLPASPFRTDDWPGVTINNH